MVTTPLQTTTSRSKRSTTTTTHKQPIEVGSSDDAVHNIRHDELKRDVIQTSSVELPPLLYRAAEERTILLLKTKVFPDPKYIRYKDYFDKHYDEQPFQVVQNMMKNLHKEQERSPYNLKFIIKYDQVNELYTFDD